MITTKELLVATPEALKRYQLVLEHELFKVKALLDRGDLLAREVRFVYLSQRKPGESIGVAAIKMLREHTSPMMELVTAKRMVDNLMEGATCLVELSPRTTLGALSNHPFTRHFAITPQEDKCESSPS